jgi:hypothetical protein
VSSPAIVLSAAAARALFGDEEHHVARFASLPSFTAGLSEG